MDRLLHDDTRRLAGDVSIKVLKNEQATGAAIEEALGRIEATVGPEDQVLVYHSGHSSRISGQENGQSDIRALVPFDFSRRMIPLPEIVTRLARMKAAQKILIFDA